MGGGPRYRDGRRSVEEEMERRGIGKKWVIITKAKAEFLEFGRGNGVSNNGNRNDGVNLGGQTMVVRSRNEKRRERETVGAASEWKPQG